MVRFKPLTPSLTPSTQRLSPYFLAALLLTMTVDDAKAAPSLTLTVNTDFPLTAVNTVNTPLKSMFLKRHAVNDDC